MRTREEHRPDRSARSPAPIASVFDAYMDFYDFMGAQVYDVFCLPLHMLIKMNRRPPRLVVDNSRTGTENPCERKST